MHLSRNRATFLAAATAALLVMSSTASPQSLLARVGSNTSEGAGAFRSASGNAPFGTYSASASYGELIGNASVGIAEPGSENGLTTHAQFLDSLTIDHPGAATFGGTMTALIRLSGVPAFERSRTSQAVAQSVSVGYQVLRLQNGGSFFLRDGSILYNTAMVPEVAEIGVVPAPGLILVEYPFSFGFAFDFGLFLSVHAAAHNSFFPPEDGSVSGSSSVSVEWLGIRSIRDQNGNELRDDAILVSASGTDWAASPTEPMEWPGDLGATADDCTDRSAVYGTGCAGTGGFEPRLRLSGCASLGEEMVLRVDQGLGGALSYLVLGWNGRTSVNYRGCDFLVQGPLVLAPVFLSGTGPGEGGFVVPREINDPAFVGFQLNMQCLIRDSGAARGISASNGLEIVFGD